MRFRLLLSTLAVCLLVVVASPSWAATIIVDETTCTLVDAITAANADAPTGGCPAGSGPDTIELMTDVTLTETNNTYLDLGGNALPVIESEISIEGAGFTIGRTDNWNPWSSCPRRVFFVLEIGTLRLKDTTLVRVNSGGSGAQSEALIHPRPCNTPAGIDIRNRGSLFLTNTTLHDEMLNEGGSASLADCTLPHISNTHGSVRMTRCTVSGSFAPDPQFAPHAWSGRGIVSLGGDLTVTYSTVSGNQGGIYIGEGGQLDLVHSLVSDNHAALGCCGTGFGGGIWCAEGSNCSVANSTLSGNSAFEIYFRPCNPQNEPCRICEGSCFPVGTGGDIYASGDASVSIVNSTLFGDQGGTIRWEDTVLPPALASSIVTNTCPGSGVTDLGNNLYADCGSSLSVITGLDPILADNGGPTLTHALLPGSSALDAAGDCGLVDDQRGLLRWDGACDSGAFELGAIACDDEGDDEGNDECDDEGDDEGDDGGGRPREPTIFERNWNLPSNGNVNLQPK